MPSGNEINFFINSILAKPQACWNESQINLWAKKRSFFSCNGKYNYLSYMKTGSPNEEKKFLEIAKDDTMPNNAVKRSYFRYMSNREKSEGLFDKDGICNLEQEKFHKNHIQNAGGTIWEGVISFEKEFGEKYCCDIEKAQSAMKAVMKKFLDNTHLKDKNIEWVASLHENTEHYHIHFTFFEKEPWRMVKGKKKLQYSNKFVIDMNAINKLKQSFYKYFLEHSIDVFSLRDNSLKMLRSYYDDLTPNGRLYKQFKQLTENLKKENKIDFHTNYKNLNNDAKEVINDFIMNMIKANKNLYKNYNDTFMKLYSAEEKINDFAKKRNEKPIISKAKTFRSDFYNRLGNEILQTCLLVINMQNEGNKKIKEIGLRKSKRYVNRDVNKIKKGLADAEYHLFAGIIEANCSEEVLKNYSWLAIECEAQQRELEEKMSNENE